MTNVKNFDEIKEYLLSDKEKLIEVVSIINRYNGDLDDLDIYENDEEFFEMFFDGNAYRLVQKIFYGDYNFNHKYVRFDGYDNLESFESYEYEEILEDDINRIINSLAENVEEINLDEYEKYKDLYELITA